MPVFVCEDRLEGLKRIAETGLADAVVLDDGLQHRRLKPTVSLMLVDTTQPVDRDHFLPRGRLRDLPTRVPEADAVILTRCPSPYTKGDLSSGVTACGSSQTNPCSIPAPRSTGSG